MRTGAAGAGYVNKLHVAEEQCRRDEKPSAHNYYDSHDVVETPDLKRHEKRKQQHITRLQCQTEATEPGEKIESSINDEAWRGNEGSARWSEETDMGRNIANEGGRAVEGRRLDVTHGGLRSEKDGCVSVGGGPGRTKDASETNRSLCKAYLRKDAAEERRDGRERIDGQ